MVARFIASSCSLTRPFRLALVLITLLLTLPQTAWGVTEEVTKTITFNKAISTVSSNINKSKMSVSVKEQVTGGASITYDGKVNVLDDNSLLNQYNCSTTDGAVFTLKSTAIYGQIFTIEIPGNYPAVPKQVTLKVGWEHAKSSGATGEIVAKIQVGDYDTGSLTGSGATDPTVIAYANNHPFLSDQISKQHFDTDPLVYTANSTNDLGTNRETRKSLYIYVSLNGNDVPQYPTTFTIKEATITYDREAYGPVVAGIHVGDDNASNVLSDDYSSVSYDEGSNTLTLKGVHLNSSNNGISVPSDMNINLVGYSDVGTINVTSGTLNFTTSTTLPGCLKTNVAGNSTITYGAGTGLSWNGTMVKSSITNPIGCYVTGYKAGGDNYTIDGADGDCEIYSESSAVIHLHASNATVDQNNRYIKVSPATSTPNEAYLCPSDLTSMYPLTKIYLQYEWGTCANHNVSVKAMGFTSTGDYAHNSVSYSDPVDLGDGGIVEIPLTSEVTDGLVGLVFTSSSDFSLIPINVGFLKYTTPTDYGLTIAGTAVTSANAGNVFSDATNPRVVFTPATESNPTNTLTLNAYQNNSNSKIASNLPNLTIVINGENSIGDNGGRDGFIESTNANATLTFKKGSANSTLELHSNNNDAVVQGFASVSYDETYYRYSSAVKYDTSEKKYKDRYGLQNLLTITTTPQYLIWIEGEQVSDETKNNLAGGKATFTPGTNTTPNTLLLNGASISSMTAIESDLDNLTISLIGDNSVSTYYTGYNSIYSFNPNATLIIKKAGDAECALRLRTQESHDQVIKGFASVTHTGLNFVSKTGSALTDDATHDADLSSATIYPLRVEGYVVTDLNKDEILGESVKFDGTNTLTLNNATISGMIESGLGNLTIHLTGDNIIREYNNETNLIVSTNNGVLTFETDENPGNLHFTEFNMTDPFSGNPINGFTNVVYGTGVDYNATNKIIEDVTYNFYIGKNGSNSPTWVYSHSKNDILGDGGSVKYSHDAVNGHIITLKNASINYIDWEIGEDFTIAIDGENTINNPGTVNKSYVISAVGHEVTFKKAEGASSAKLTLSIAESQLNVIYSATTTSEVTGLYRIPVSKYSEIISDNPNYITANGVVVSNGGTFNGTSGTLTYDATDKILTLNNYQISSGTNAIETGIEGLKVKVIGNENIITCTAANTYAFHAIGSNASIQFVKDDATSKLTMNTTTDNPIGGFADGKITYDGLVYQSSGGNEKAIFYPTAPRMDLDTDGKVKMQRDDYTGGTIAIKYSIDYADETADVTNATYSAPFAMAAPGTLTAWVEANGATTSTIKGKFFGYQDAPFNMLVGETNTPVLIPAIETGDNLMYSAVTPYSSSDDNVATFSNGTITAQGIGTATLTTTLVYDGNVPDHITLLNQGGKFTTNVTVGRVFNDITFTDGQNFATYYNIGGNITVPEGLTAYMITGTNNNSVVTTAVGYLPYGVPLLLEKSTNAGGTLTTTTYSGTELTDAEKGTNKLIYAEGEYIASDMIAQGNTPFVLYKNEFVKATGTIPPGRVFLMLNGVNFARGLNIGNGDDGATAIESLTPVLSEEDDGAWYDLQGRRIEQPTKPGLYIKNGKKVIVNKK